MELSEGALKIRNAILKEYDIVDDAGQAILQTGMEAYDLMQKAQEQVDRDGLTVAGDRGGIKAHPLLACIRDSRAQFLMALKHLNLDIEPIKQMGRPPGR